MVHMFYAVCQCYLSMETIYPAICSGSNPSFSTGDISRVIAYTSN